MYRYLFLVVALISNVAFSIDPLQLISTKNNNLEFESKNNYLNLNLIHLNVDKPELPSAWDLILGKKAKYGVIYMEINNNSKIKKIPIYSYVASGNKSYDVQTLGVTKTISYPLLNNALIKSNSFPKIKMYVRYWQDKGDSETVKNIFNFVGSAGVVDTEFFSFALDLVDRFWPPQSESNTMELVLNEENIKRNKSFSYGYRGQSILTIELSSGEPYFIKDISNEALAEAGIKGLAGFPEKIKFANGLLSQQGIDYLLPILKEYSEYISNLELSWADRVFLFARSLEQWAPNAVSGSVRHNGRRVKLTYEQYIELGNADIALLESTDERLLAGLGGARPCTSPLCNRINDFLIASQNGESTIDFFAPRVRVFQDGVLEIVDKENISFVPSKRSRHDGFGVSKNSFDQWDIEYDSGNLPFMFDGKQYEDRSVVLGFGGYTKDGKLNYSLQEIRISSLQK